MTWPRDERAAMDAFYGPIELGASGLPTAAWEQRTLVNIVPPYPLVLAWNMTQAVRSIRCHRLVADSLTRILTAIGKLYPTSGARRLVGVDLLGGVYNYRPVAGAARLSVHSWGAAIDLDPVRNPRLRQWNPATGIPQAVVDAFKSESWRWGGDWTRQPDPMHFEATS